MANEMPSFGAIHREARLVGYRHVLESLGIDHKHLTGKHGPCPLCGGKDRFRYTDYKCEGYSICNRCGPRNGPQLVKDVLGVADHEAFRLIWNAINVGDCVTVRPQSDGEEKRCRNRRLIEQYIDESSLIGWNDDCPGTRYLESRGIVFKTREYPITLRVHPGLPCCQDGAILGRFPALLGIVTDPDDRLVTISRTFLTNDGRKAPVISPRRLYPICRDGLSRSTVRIVRTFRTLAIAEGLETALAYWQLTGVPSWACLSANGIKNFSPPADVESLIIAADLDANQVGQNAAYETRERLRSKLDVEIHLPGKTVPRGKKSLDWNDVLLRSRGAA